MHQLRNYGDERQTAGCAHCGKATGTRDHIPAKVFLDEPLPENLPVVFSCETCNNDASWDEVYLASLIDCALTGTTAEHPARRTKVLRALLHDDKLTRMLTECASTTSGRLVWAPRIEAVQRVVIKIARGLALFELNEPHCEPPTSIAVFLLGDLTDEQRMNFERIEAASIWPEVGSRAMQRLFVEEEGPAGWIVLQAGRFRFGLDWNGGQAMVRMIFSEYLAAEVIWSDG